MPRTLTLEEFERGLSPAPSRLPPVPRRRPERLSVEEFEAGLMPAPRRKPVRASEDLIEAMIQAESGGDPNAVPRAYDLPLGQGE